MSPFATCGEWRFKSGNIQLFRSRFLHTFLNDRLKKLREKAEEITDSICQFDLISERSNSTLDCPTFGLHLGGGDVEGGDGEGGDNDDDDDHRGEVQSQRAGVHAGDLHVGFRGRRRLVFIYLSIYLFIYFYLDLLLDQFKKEANLTKLIFIC